MLISDGYAIKGDVEKVKVDKKDVNARWGGIKERQEMPQSHHLSMGRRSRATERRKSSKATR